MPRRLKSCPYCRSYLLLPVLLTVMLAGCGGVKSPAPAPTNCQGLQCATLFKKYDVSCPQNSGRNNRTYASATQSNLTVNFFYLLNQYDGQGNQTSFQNSAVLDKTTEVPLACDYDVKGGTQYQYDITKECATTRSGAALANCTTQERSIAFNSTATTRSLETTSASIAFDPATLLKTHSSCVDICKTPGRACLSVPFSRDQTRDLDLATGILFGGNSRNDLKGCKESVEVKTNGSTERMVSVTGTANACVIDVNSQVGQFEILIPRGTDLKTLGDLRNFAIAPTSTDTPVIKLPNDVWQNRYGGRVFATEGAQAYTVITTENGCIRLERFH